MPTPIEQLQSEHRIIEKALHALDGLIQRLEHGETADPDSFEKLFEFLSVFADQRHHQKEEKCLFPALGLHGVPRDRGPVGVMLQEHCTGRALIALMRRAAAALADGDPNATRQFTDAARGYVELITEHIRKEDQVLFRLAEQLLNGQAMQLLEENFTRFEAAFTDDSSYYEQAAAELEGAWAL